jgi:hypothetical protein
MFQALGLLGKSSSDGRKSALQLAVEQADDLTRFFVILHALLDQLAGMDDGAVIPAAERIADIGERHAGVLAAEIHGKLTGQGDIGWAAFAAHVRDANIEMLGHTALDLVDRDRFFGLLLKNIAQKILDNIARDLSIAQ